MYKKIGVLAFIIVFTFCACEEKSREILEVFPNSKEVKSELLSLREGYLKDPSKIILVDSLMIVVSDKGDYFIDIVDLNQLMICGQLGFKGNGPNEFLSISNIEYRKGSINLYDNIKKRIIRFIPPNILLKNKKPSVIWRNDLNTMFLQTVIGNNDVLISSGIMKSGMYSIVNVQDSIIKYFHNYIVDKERINDDNRLKGIAYQGLLKCHPTKNQFVFAAFNGGVFEIGSYNTDTITIKSGNYFHLPKYLPAANGQSAAIKRDCLLGFQDVCVTEKSIFLLYTGQKVENFVDKPLLTNYILEFDWNGKPLCKYFIDKGVRCITIGHGDKELYGITYSPDPQIIKINLELK